MLNKENINEGKRIPGIFENLIINTVSQENVVGQYAKCIDDYMFYIKKRKTIEKEKEQFQKEASIIYEEIISEIKNKIKSKKECSEVEKQKIITKAVKEHKKYQELNKKYRDKDITKADIEIDILLLDKKIEFYRTLILGKDK